MSESAAQFLLETRGTQRDLDAFVVAAGFDRAGDHRWRSRSATEPCAWSPIADRETWRAVEAHDGAILALSPDAAPTGFVSGGDDGKFRRIGADGAVSDIADFGIEMGGACRQPSRREGQGPAGLRRRQDRSTCSTTPARS